MNFKLFGKTILVVNIKFGLFVGPSTQPVRQAKWLSKMLKGELKIPSPGAMEKVIEKEKAWKRSWMPPMSSRACIWQLHMLKYHEILLADMKETRFRKMPNCFGELFMPYTAADYRSLFTQG